MKEEYVYTIYIIHYNRIENLYTFKCEQKALTKQLELAKKWVNEDTFEEYCVDNDITDITDMTVDMYDSYFLEVEDEVYVSMEKSILE